MIKNFYKLGIFHNSLDGLNFMFWNLKEQFDIHGYFPLKKMQKRVRTIKRNLH